MQKGFEKIYYDEIFYKAPLAIALISYDGIIIDVNLEFIKLFKYSEEELIGKNIDNLITNEKIKPEAMNLTTKAKKERIEIKTVRFDKYKNPINVAVLGIAFTDSSGRKLIFATYRDITQSTVQEKKIIVQKEIIALINKILRHDLMNYFNVIRSAFRIYNETKEPDLLKEAMMQTEKGIELIRNMRNFEQIKMGPEALTTINVKKEIENIAKLYAVEINIFGELFVRADKTFSRIIENLINNAIKHGKATKIDIELIENETENVILVKDNGVGIPEKIKKVIFEEGFSYGKSGNTGLGLFIVKKLMEIFNGKVEVLDNKPKGTIFKLIFFK
jgi:PAS domain S-box-containing protein